MTNLQQSGSYVLLGGSEGDEQVDSRHPNDGRSHSHHPHAHLLQQQLSQNGDRQLQRNQLTVSASRQHQRHNNGHLLQSNEESAGQPVSLYSYASGSDGEGEGNEEQSGKRHSISSMYSRSSCSCDERPQDEEAEINNGHEQDENAVYASLRGEGASAALPLLSLNRPQQQRSSQGRQGPAVPPRPIGQQVVSAYAVSDLGRVSMEDGRRRGEASLVPQPLISPSQAAAAAHGSAAVQSATSTLPFPRTVPRRQVAPNLELTGQSQMPRMSQENIRDGRLDFVPPDIRHASGPQASPIPPPPSSPDFYDFSTLRAEKQLSSPRRWRCAAITLLLLSVPLLGLTLYFIILRIQMSFFDPQHICRETCGSFCALPSPVSYQLGTEAVADLGPESFWRLQINVLESSFVKCNVSVSKDGALGIFGRKGALSTVVQYDFFEQLLTRSRNKRSTLETDLHIFFVRYFDAGPWHISIYNDNNFSQRVTFKTQLQDKQPNNCPNACSGHGECSSGQCHCFSGYSGADCSHGVCPVLCSGHGMYVGGACKCFSGWKGSECALPSDTCEDPWCSGNGYCEAGSCVCMRGYKGDHCEHEICHMPCLHGTCHQQRCQCDQGWTGAYCDQLACDSRCTAHGFCNNGSCTCSRGWNGKQCSMEGCPNNCNNNGDCYEFHGEWKCSCKEGWKGDACHKSVEIKCGDGSDNDNDGLSDCQDSDCCISVECKDHILCAVSADPLEILLRKQPPTITASFYERMKFLVEDSSVQSGATLSSFNDSHVSVIRGQVITSDGSSVIGARVSIHQQPLYGATLSRELGYFDLLVNGGGSIKLQIQRQPFVTKHVTVMVSWNKIVVMEPIVLYLEAQRVPTPVTCANVTHDYDLQPRLFSLWQHTQQATYPALSTVIPESQVVQEVIPLPDTGIYLMYHSSRSAGYMSTLFIQLTPDQLPHGLVMVHLRINVEGFLFEKTFEAEPNLKYKFAWDRRNAYGQKSFGIVNALVSTGYQYQQCITIYWTTQTATLSGCDISSSEIGGWNLNIHHTYNFQEGVLHRGDGTNIYLRERPKRSSVIVGNGRARTADCRGCDGKVAGKSLLAPIALASGRDGSLYIGDFNYIRKISPNREDISSILEIEFADHAHKYYMTVSPLDGRLYVSDYRSRRLLRVKTMGAVRDLKQNAEVIAGTGELCVPGDASKCGEGGPASAAKLSFPKGIAIDKDGKLYVADGANIRSVGEDGVMRMEVGVYGQLVNWTSFPCDGDASAAKVQLHWPTAVAISPLDNSLHILDSNMVLRLTQNGRLVRVAGYPQHCPHKTHVTSLLLSEEDVGFKRATEVFLRAPQHIAFAANGDLYIVDSDRKEVNQVLVVTTDGLLHHFAGASTKCNCTALDPTCRCAEGKEDLASKTMLRNPSSVTILPDDVVCVTDMDNLRLVAFSSVLPSADEVGNYRVVSPYSQELYIFNRFGKHIATRNLVTDQLVYNFTYDFASSHGKLIKVTDSDGKSLTVVRDYMTQAKEIVTPSGRRCKIEVDHMVQLAHFVVADDSSTSLKFEYLSSSELLYYKETSSNTTYIYEYDESGRVTEVVYPSGETTIVASDVSDSGAVYSVHAGHAADSLTLITNQNELIALHGGMKAHVIHMTDGSMTVEYPFNMAVAVTTKVQTLSNTADHQMQISRRILLPDGLTYRVDWKYFQRRSGEASRSRKTKAMERAGRKLRINGTAVFSVEYDREAQSEYVIQADGTEILAVLYSDTGLPVTLTPNVSLALAGLNITYNDRGQALSWNHGDRTFANVYDSVSGLLTERVLSNKATYRYLYKHNRRISDVVMPSGKQYSVHYDSAGNLQTIVTPASLRHRFQTWSMLATSRKMYAPPGSHGTYWRDFVGDGHLKQVSYPSMQRYITFAYDQISSLPRAVFYDWTSITFTFHRDSNRLKYVNLTDKLSNFTCDIFLGPNSALYTEQNVSVKSTFIANLVNASVRYRYDSNFRVVSTETLIANRSLPVVSVTYDTQTGKMLTMKSFKFDYLKRVRDNIHDQNVVITREYDGYGMPKDTWYKFSNYLVFTMEARYDVLGRLQLYRRKVGSSDLKVYEYTYNSDGHLANVLLGSSVLWRYEYDSDGNIVKITQPNQVREFFVDTRGHVVNATGGRSWIYDKDGFLKQRNSEQFEFNSRGQLMKAYQPNLYHVEYFYDGLGRLVVRSDVLTRTVVQFFYLDITHPHRISHVFNQTSQTLDILFYDSSDNLFSFQRNSQYYYIASDPNRSPIVVFSSVGAVVKQLTYDPFGAVTADTAVNFAFAFGFRCGTADPATKLVYINSRFYDAETGRWISPDYAQLLDNLPQFFDNPLLINTYQYHHSSKMNSLPLTDMSEWLRLLGYDWSSLVPEVDFLGDLRRQQQLLLNNWAQQDKTQLAPTSTYQCVFERNVAELNKLSMVSPSALLAPSLHSAVSSTLQLSPQRRMFGAGIVLARKNGRVSVEVLDYFNDNLLTLATTLLNGSYIVDSHLTYLSHNAFYFVRTSYSDATADIQALMLNDTNRIHGINVTIHRSQREESSASKFVDIRLAAGHVVLNIRYGTTLEEEERHVQHLATEKTAAAAWQLERETVQSGRHSAYTWSESERHQLLTLGSVVSYVVEFVHDIQLAPQLAEDPRNVRFVKTP